MFTIIRQNTVLIAQKMCVFSRTHTSVTLPSTHLLIQETCSQPSLLDTWEYSSEPNNSLTVKALTLQQRRQIIIKQISERNSRRQCRLYRKLKHKKGKERNCVRWWGCYFRYGGRGRPAEEIEQQHFIYCIIFLLSSWQWSIIAWQP